MRIVPRKFQQRPLTVAVEWHDTQWQPAIVTRINKPASPSSHPAPPSGSRSREQSLGASPLSGAAIKPLIETSILGHPVRRIPFPKI